MPNGSRLFLVRPQFTRWLHHAVRVRQAGVSGRCDTICLTYLRLF